MYCHQWKTTNEARGRKTSVWSITDDARGESILDVQSGVVSRLFSNGIRVRWHLYRMHYVHQSYKDGSSNNNFWQCMRLPVNRMHWCQLVLVCSFRLSPTHLASILLNIFPPAAKRNKQTNKAKKCSVDFNSKRKKQLLFCFCFVLFF